MAEENQNLVKIKRPKIILCDIEGTTTAITFVKEKLFPYVRAKLRNYLIETWDTDTTRNDIKLLFEQYQKDMIDDQLFDLRIGNNCSFDIDTVCVYVDWLMDHDRKVGPLKQLQGHVWENGYNTGQILGHVYDDVSRCFRRWTSKFNVKIGIYSSGSVLAQKLLFSHSIHGDLTPFISYYFDTNIGPKQSTDSYRLITEKVGSSATDIVFLTDVPKEAKAAKESGMMAILSERDGIFLTPDDKHTFNSITSFDKIIFLEF
ncbi:Enolase-phosphatase E1 [Dermatophagoides farinae]|uniref:Enolase-phosphatase E1 n=2 Tax=Dermatophagoides farinae TaxID=6954 RepID=A0A922IFG2_DERFA|nr:enolase-phosphatase e1-like [Dermatophagoides farinae]KAH9529185.1 Enolase-phosphatase E1 [Dermatophagoides farinae]